MGSSRFVWEAGVNQHGLPKREQQELTDQDEHLPQANSQVQKRKNNNHAEYRSSIYRYGPTLGHRNPDRYGP